MACIKKGLRTWADNIVIFEDDILFDRFSPAVLMIDIVHYLTDDALRLTFKNLYDRLKSGRQLIIRASIPPTRQTPWVWWLENFKLKLNQTPSYYRSAETLRAMLVETDFIVDQTKPSGANGELVWLIATKENASEKN